MLLSFVFRSISLDYHGGERSLCKTLTKVLFSINLKIPSVHTVLKCVSTIVNDYCLANVHSKWMYSVTLQIILFVLSETNSCLDILAHAIATIMSGFCRSVSQLSISNDRWLMSHGNSSHLLPASSIQRKEHVTMNFIPLLSNSSPPTIF